MVIICADHVHCFWYEYFTGPADSWNTPTQTQFTCSPQSDHSLTCSCYSIYVWHMEKTCGTFASEYHTSCIWYAGHYSLECTGPTSEWPTYWSRSSQSMSLYYCLIVAILFIFQKIVCFVYGWPVCRAILWLRYLAQLYLKLLSLFQKYFPKALKCIPCIQLCRSTSVSLYYDWDVQVSHYKWVLLKLGEFFLTKILQKGTQGPTKVNFLHINK